MASAILQCQDGPEHYKTDESHQKPTTWVYSDHTAWEANCTSISGKQIPVRDLWP